MGSRCLLTYQAVAVLLVELAFCPLHAYALSAPPVCARLPGYPGLLRMPKTYTASNTPPTKLRVHSEEGGSGPEERGGEEAEPLRVKLASPLTEEVRAARAKEQQVLEVARRVFLGASLVSALLNYLRIYGQSEHLLRFCDQADDLLRQALGRPVAGSRGKGQARRPLDAAFVRLTADAIEHVAVTEQRITSPDVLHANEQALALRAASFFGAAAAGGGVAAGIQKSTLAETMAAAGFDALYEEEDTANLALYARLHVLEDLLISPASRKSFSAAVGRRVLLLLRRQMPQVDRAITQSAAAGPRDCDTWLKSLELLVKAYTDAGVGVACVGENGTGLLDTEVWKEDTPMTGCINVFVYNFVFNDAAQVLAGEAMDDLAQSLLPTPVLKAFFEELGISCDADSFYLSSRYRRNPADYRPDSVAVVSNLSA